MTDFDEGVHPRARTGVFVEKANDAPTATLDGGSAAGCCGCCTESCGEAHQVACEECAPQEVTPDPGQEPDPAAEKPTTRRRTPPVVKAPTRAARATRATLHQGRLFLKAATVDLKSAIADIFD